MMTTTPCYPYRIWWLCMFGMASWNMEINMLTMLFPNKLHTVLTLTKAQSFKIYHMTNIANMEVYMTQFCFRLDFSHIQDIKRWADAVELKSKQIDCHCNVGSRMWEIIHFANRQECTILTLYWTTHTQIHGIRDHIWQLCILPQTSNGCNWGGFVGECCWDLIAIRRMQIRL